MTCATCGRPIAPCDGLPAPLAELVITPDATGADIAIAHSRGLPCRLGGYVHTDQRIRRANSHLCGREHGAATARPRQESRA